MLRKLKANGILCTVDNRSEKIGYKIREARLARVPYMLVVGEKEQSEGKVSVRSRFLQEMKGEKDLTGIYRCRSAKKSGQKKSVRLR